MNGGLGMWATWGDEAGLLSRPESPSSELAAVVLQFRQWQGRFWGTLILAVVESPFWGHLTGLVGTTGTILVSLKPRHVFAKSIFGRIKSFTV